MTVFRRLRLAHGLHWAGKYPPIPYREIAVVIACALVMYAAHRYDNLAERALVMERAAEIEGALASVLRNCESGATGYYYQSSGKSFECPRPL